MRKKFTRDVLINSKLFLKYQNDFLSAILTKEEYTIAEAKKIVEAFFYGKKGDK